MTNKKSNGNSKSRSPSGMTNRKARAKATTTSIATVDPLRMTSKKGKKRVRVAV
jgi:hypothetical protein